MAWSGVGTFSRTNGTHTGSSTWVQDRDAGDYILATRHDTHDQDLADGINACLTKNNETKPTATFLPNADGTLDLGSSSVRWRKGFFSGELAGGNLFAKSGASGTISHLSIGRTGYEAAFGIAAATDHWFTGTAAGDAALAYGTKLWIGTGDFDTAGTHYFTMWGDGRLSGTALHNNAGAVTGTTNQYIASGTYTPTGTVGTNCDSVSSLTGQWLRVGNVVVVSGGGTADPTASGHCDFTISLPIASDLSASSTANGAGAGAFIGAGGDVHMTAYVTTANPAKAALRFLAPSGVASSFYFSLTYLIL